MENELAKIIDIGKKEKCTIEEMHYFLPNYPKLRGSEFIFSDKCKFVKGLTFEDIEFLIKGLHYIELKYREITEHDFGFGSPSSTHLLIKLLEKRNVERSKILTEWIKLNGGNYYYKPIEVKIKEDTKSTNLFEHEKKQIRKSATYNGESIEQLCKRLGINYSKNQQQSGTASIHFINKPKKDN